MAAALEHALHNNNGKDFVARSEALKAAQIKYRKTQKYRDSLARRREKRLKYALDYYYANRDDINEFRRKKNRALKGLPIN